MIKTPTKLAKPEGMYRSQSHKSLSTTADSISSRDLNGSRDSQKRNDYLLSDSDSFSSIPSSESDRQQKQVAPFVKAITPTHVNNTNNAASFQPYKLKDYKVILKSVPQRMGGLGANTNTDEWHKRKEKQERSSNFAEKLRMNVAEHATVNMPMPGRQYKLKLKAKVNEEDNALDIQ